MVYKNLFKRGMAPEMIRRGNKLIEMSIGKTKKPSKKTKKRSETKEAKETKGKFTETIFRDSFNLTHMPLSAFVKAFDFEVEEKMHFPYHYIQEENFDITLPNLPDIEYYTPDAKKPKARNDLLQWYEQHQQ